MVDLLGGQVLVLLAHPPIHETDERPDQEADDGLELERIELPGRLQARQFGAGEVLEPLRRLATREGTALTARDGLEQPLPQPEVPEQLERPAKCRIIGLPGARVGAGHVEVGEDRHQQVVLVDEVRVEGRAPDVSAIDHVLDRDPLVALLEDQVRKRFLQRLPRPIHAAVRPGGALRASDRHLASPASGHRPAQRSTTNTLGPVVG